MDTKIRYFDRCIYCGSVENLTDEHALPKALKGVWILKNASCSKCSEVTSKVEREVLRGVYYLARLRYGLKGYRKLPKEYVITGIDLSGKKATKKVSVEKHGAVISLIGYKRPAYLDGRQYSKGIDVVASYFIRTNGSELEELGKELGFKELSFTVEYKYQSFERFMCKVAYCLSIFAYGLDAFEEVYILDTISGKKDDAGMWVGSSEPILGNADTWIQLYEKGKDVICELRIFGKLPVPTYIVVVGKLF